MGFIAKIIPLTLFNRIKYASPMRPIFDFFNVSRILFHYFGHTRSVRELQAVNQQGAPIPWMTYPFIEYVNGLDLSKKHLFEYGSGNSTLYWATRCTRVVSVEHNPEWYKKVKPRLPANAEYLLAEDARSYSQSILAYEGGFDVIVIDGEYRYDCAVAALKALRPGGMIVLDNADWQPNTTRMLRDTGLLQVDFHGFLPIAEHTIATTVFFHREAAFAPRYDRQPVPGIGSMTKEYGAGKDTTALT
jgi:Methyltransferase domain